MIFTSLPELLAHLKKEMPRIILLQAGERFAIDEALDAIKKRYSDLPYTHIKDGSWHYEPSFFKEKRLICIENCESLSGYVQNPDPDIVLVIVSEKMAIDGHVQLRLAKEAPWEKEAKLVRYIESFFKDRGIKCDAKLCAQLAKGCNGDFQLLVHELEKLIAYIGDAKEVRQLDVEAISILFQQTTLWQLSDAILQGTGQDALQALRSIEKQDVYNLVIVRHLRTSMHQLLEIASMIGSEQPFAKIAEHFPKLKGRLFEKAFNQAQSLGTNRLTHAITTIDSAELALKDSAADESTLLETLILKLKNALYTS